MSVPLCKVNRIECSTLITFHLQHFVFQKYIFWRSSFILSWYFVFLFISFGVALASQCSLTVRPDGTRSYFILLSDHNVAAITVRMDSSEQRTDLLRTPFPALPLSAAVSRGRERDRGARELARSMRLLECCSVDIREWTFVQRESIPFAMRMGTNTVRP